MTDGYKYRAFISYSHADESWAKWLHQKLERYRVPSRLVGRQTPSGTIPRRIGRCFRDQAELSAAAHLGETLQEALRASQVLIVVCSPRSAASHWVNEEIKFFRSLGRGDRVYALIVDGHPHDPDPTLECFPHALRDSHPLAADARESADGRNDSFLKLVAGILGLGFDELRQRERRRRARLLTLTAAASLGIAASTTILALSAYHARNEALRRHQQADHLIGFMLGDLKEELTQVGRLDALDATVAEAQAYVDDPGSTVAEPSALAQRARLLTAIAEVRTARLQTAQGLAAATEALKVARQLQAIRPDQESDKLATAAVYALSLAGDTYTVPELAPELRTQLAVARRWVRETRDPGWALLDAHLAFALADSLTNVQQASPDREEAKKLLDECREQLQPLAATANRHVDQYVRAVLDCEIDQEIQLDDGQVSSQLARDASDLVRRFPKDLELQGLVLQALRGSVSVLGHSDVDPQGADLAAQGIRQLGAALHSHDPDNSAWAFAYADGLTWAAYAQRRIGQLDAAQADADQSLRLFDEILSRTPEAKDSLWELMHLRIIRAQVAFDRKDSSTGFDELDAGLNVPPKGQESQWAQMLLRVRIQQWHYALSFRPGLVAEARDAALALSAHLQATQASSIGFAEPKAQVAWLDGQLENGDALMRAALANRSRPIMRESLDIRAAACARQRQTSGKACPSWPSQ